MDKVFTNGFVVKEPHKNAPAFVKCAVSIKTDEFVKFLEDHTKPDGWVNLDIKVGQSGKWYAQLNQWSKETEKEKEAEIQMDAPPF